MKFNSERVYVRTASSYWFFGTRNYGYSNGTKSRKSWMRCECLEQDKEQNDPLISLGAKYKSSPEEVAASCDVTFAMLADPGSTLDVACGKHGVASGMSPGKGYVDISTVDVDTSKLISSHIKTTGALFLEALVSGSKKPAEDGQLIFLTAGCMRCAKDLEIQHQLADYVWGWMM
ncbi:hypothetical protein ACS0TY_012770 [Phlomoides rotata]